MKQALISEAGYNNLELPVVAPAATWKRKKKNPTVESYQKWNIFNMRY